MRKRKRRRWREEVRKRMNGWKRKVEGKEWGGEAQEEVEGGGGVDGVE